MTVTLMVQYNRGLIVNNYQFMKVAFTNINVDNTG